jgi:hypothetical protein
MRESSMGNKKLFNSFKSDIYDLDEPPHTFYSSRAAATTATVVSYGGMILKKEVAAYISLLFKLKIGYSMSPDAKYYLSQYMENRSGRITVHSKDVTSTSYKQGINLYEKNYQEEGELDDGGSGDYDSDGRAL